MRVRTIRAAIAVLVPVAVLLPTLVAGAATSQLVQVTTDTNRDAETSISINPTNPLNVVAGWITSEPTDGTCGFAASFDGGKTWTTPGVVPGVDVAHGGAFDIGTDPSVVFDRAGKAHYTCLGFDLFPPGTGSAGTMLVSTSTDGGVTWGDPVVAMDGEDAPGNSVREFQDHQFLTSNPVNGHLYMTQTEFTAFGKPEILFARSTDGNQTWSAPVRINDFEGNASFQDSFSAVGRNAQTIYVTFGAFSNAGLSNWDRIYIARSTNGGLSFSRPQLLAQITPLPDPLPNSPWRSDNNLWAAVDRATNQIYVNFSDYNAGDADVKVMRVADLGNTFQVQGITNLNAVESGSDQFFPFVTVGPTGRVDVCYQDRSYEPGNALIFTTCAFSTNAGVSFANQQVTTAGFDASNNNFIGDYNWQASTRRFVMPIFVGDGVSGGGSTAQEVFVAKVTP
jgi:hypothetical protein